jgi:peptide/nickel transport system ATP-binding protein
MYLGRIVEIGGTEQIFTRPLHPYTRGLLDSEPPIQPGIPWIITPMKGETPSATVEISGCAFRDRCPIATEHCSTIDPQLTSRDAGRSIACLNN